MKRIKKLVIGGIQNKIFNLVLFTTIFIVGVFALVLHFYSGELTKIVETTNEQQRSSISEISSQTMRLVVDESLNQITGLEGYIANTVFSDVLLDVELMQHFAEDLYSRPEKYGNLEVSAPLSENEGSVTSQLLYKEGLDPEEKEVQGEIGLLANLSSLMEALVESDEHLGACYIGTVDGVLIISDAHSGQKFTDDGNELRVDPTQRYWYTGAVNKGAASFSKLEEDFFTGKSNITCSAPVYVDGQLEAVVGADMFLDDLEDAVMSSDTGGGFEVIVDEDGHVIFSPETEGVFRLYVTSDAPDLRESDQEQLAAFVQDAMQGNTEVREVEVDGNNYYMAGITLDTVGWSIIRIVDKAAVDQPMQNMLDRYEEISKASVEEYERKFPHC